LVFFLQARELKDSHNGQSPKDFDSILQEFYEHFVSRSPQSFSFLRPAFKLANRQRSAAVIPSKDGTQNHYPFSSTAKAAD
jgi:hypothetical protein